MFKLSSHCVWVICSIFCLTLTMQCSPIHVGLEYCHQDHFLSLVFWMLSQQFMCTSWIMPNRNTNTFDFLAPVIYSFHSMSCFVWRSHLPFPPVGPLRQSLLSFHFNISYAPYCLLSLFHKTSVMVLYPLVRSTLVLLPLSMTSIL